MRKGLQQGLTFVELMVVMVIMGVIAAVTSVYVYNTVSDSSTEDFVSNAKVVESAAHMYYRDEGVMPVADTTPIKKSDVDKKSLLIIRSQLLKEGVTKTEEVTDQLFKDEMVRRVDFKKLNPYTKVRTDDEGSKEFIMVGMVDDLGKKPGYGMYENEIAGFVFSDTTRNLSDGYVFSGAHRLSTDKANDTAINDMENGLGDSAYTNADDMTPYGFKIVNIKNNKNGTADVDLSWTNRLVDKDNKELKGYVVDEFQLTCDNCAEADKSKKIDKDTLTVTLKDVPVGKVVFGLQGNSVSYAGAALTGKTKIARVDGASADGSIDLVDAITNPGDGTVEVSPTLDEVVDGAQYESRNELYKELDESTAFNTNSVKAIPEGIELSDVVSGDRIVLKELRRSGSSYDFDANRTRLFIAKADKVTIPKDPYLQGDFQTNPDSEFEYIVEVYKNTPCASCGSKTSPTNAVVVYYE